MVKLAIDANGLAPIAEALSGRSRLAGVAAGLRNQMLAQELESMRHKNNLASDGEAARLRMAEAAQSRPDMQRVYDAIVGFGGDGLDMTKATGQAYQNDYRQGLGDIVSEAAKQGRWDIANSAGSLYEGKTHSPYRVDGYGQSYNQDTGVSSQTPASVAKITNIQSGTAYNNAGVGLRLADTQYTNARTGLTMQQTDTEQLRGRNLQLDGAAKELDLQNKINPQTGTAVTRAPTTDDARLFMRPVTDNLGNTKLQLDTEKMNEVYLFAQQNGYPSVSAALPAYGAAVKQAPQSAGAAAGLGSLAQIARAAQQQQEAEGYLQSHFGTNPNMRLPAVTQYDQNNKGVFGERGSGLYADHLVHYERMARDKGLPELSKTSSQADIQKTLTALANAGVPREHIEKLAIHYIGE